MAASAEPSPNGSTITTNNIHNGGHSAVPENSPVALTELALLHKVGLSVQWTSHEQSLLEKLLVNPIRWFQAYKEALGSMDTNKNIQHASDSRELRYAKIAGKLHDKTVRDVALRCRWMTKKEDGKRRKDDNSSSRRRRDKKEKKVAAQPAKPSSSHATNGASRPSAATDESDDGISYKAIGGAAGQLLEENDQTLDQISANLSALKVHENINLLSQARNNIYAIMDELKDMPGITKQMPPLPVKLNEELANTILPPPPKPRKP